MKISSASLKPVAQTVMSAVLLAMFVALYSDHNQVKANTSSNTTNIAEINKIIISVESMEKSISDIKTNNAVMSNNLDWIKEKLDH